MIGLLDENLKPVADMAYSFAAKELAPRREQSDKFPFGPYYDDVLAKAHELGFFGVTLPEELGGFGMGLSSLCVILNQISSADASMAAVVLANSYAQELMLAAGAGESLGAVTGQAATLKDFLIASPLFANPAEESITLTATAVKKGYILRGAYDFLVLGSMAGHALVPAAMEGKPGFSLFLLPLQVGGVSLSETVFTIGLHTCPAVDITVKDAKAVLIGELGQGARYFDAVAPRMYMAAAAIASGIMRGSLSEALNYSATRVQGGKVIARWSELQTILAGMSMQTQCAELLVSKICSLAEEAPSGWEEYAKAASLSILDMACPLATDGIQVLGGYGYMKDYGQEKRFRDAHQIKAVLGGAPMKKLRLIRGTLKQSGVLE